MSRGMLDQQAVADVEDLARAILERRASRSGRPCHREVLEEVQPADDIDIEQVDIRKEGPNRHPRGSKRIGPQSPELGNKLSMSRSSSRKLLLAPVGHHWVGQEGPAGGDVRPGKIDRERIERRRKARIVPPKSSLFRSRISKLPGPIVMGPILIFVDAPKSMVWSPGMSPADRSRFRQIDIDAGKGVEENVVEEVQHIGAGRPCGAEMATGQDRAGIDQELIGGLVVVGLDRDVIVRGGIDLAAREGEGRLEAELDVARDACKERAGADRSRRRARY